MSNILDINIDDVDLGFEKKEIKPTNIALALNDAASIPKTSEQEKDKPKRIKRNKKEIIEDRLKDITPYNRDNAKELIEKELSEVRGLDKEDTTVINTKDYQELLRKLNMLSESYNDVAGIFDRIELMKIRICKEIYMNFKRGQGETPITFNIDNIFEIVNSVTLPTAEEIGEAKNVE